MGMGRRMSGGGGGVVVFLVVLMNCICVNAQIYQCWGGCYNQCVLSSNKSASDTLGCFYQCFNGCLPRSPSDFSYYCLLGCTLQQCRLVPYNDGARMEKCFGRCSNLCNA